MAMARVDFYNSVRARCLDGDSTDELHHFVLCPECAQAIDLRDLDQVLHHGDPGHDWIPLDS